MHVPGRQPPLVDHARAAHDEAPEDTDQPLWVLAAWQLRLLNQLGCSDYKLGNLVCPAGCSVIAEWSDQISPYS